LPIQVHTTNPCAGQWFEDWTEFRQRVEREGVVAEYACLVDLRKEQYLLHPYTGVMGKCGLQPRSLYRRRCSRGIARLRRKEDEVYYLGGRGPNVEVAICEAN
jgi:hypothetical protein